LAPVADAAQPNSIGERRGVASVSDASVIFGDASVIFGDLRRSSATLRRRFVATPHLRSGLLSITELSRKRGQGGGAYRA
jgi:hypothetical protein